MQAVLIGYGSVGRRHARCMSEKFSTLTIVDSNPQARQAATEEYPAAVVVSELADLWQLNRDWERHLVVIATWGSSHHDIFMECVARGVRRIVCEKPLATSLREGKQTITTAQKHHVTLGVNHVQRFLGIDTGLRLLAQRLNLGEPQSIVVHGGAAGLVTNGIHFIDLATSILGDKPVAVLSTAKGEPMNPRSSSFMFYGGAAAWTFPDGRETVFSFSNRSSVFPTFTIYFRDAVIHLSGHGRVEVLRRPVMIRHGDPVTRTGQATRTMYSGKVPDALPSMEAAFMRLYDEVIKGQMTTFPAEAAYDALQACIGALVSARLGYRVGLPLDTESDVGQERFPIT